MKPIAEMLKPRESVFSDTAREDVLNLSDFAEHRIDSEKFFSENFKTQGMSMLFDTAFKRFKGESDTGVIKLTQAMGGGKTHSMLALALLAEDEKLRDRVLGTKYAGIGKIQVVTFSGRENADFGLWGNIADQLGKKDLFSGYYSPLKAPGESAWINLLKDGKILILLDELPPYLENARSITVGNSDLSKVTIAALANLFSALGKEQLANVCLVFSDLKATYESGSELLQSSFKDLEAEASRIAIEIAPVALNSDEVYSILQKRLFEDQKLSD
jgi:predicted AAA+ superfamily ATPase